MALSGSQKTRIGGQVAGVGIKQTYTAKAAGVGGKAYFYLHNLIRHQLHKHALNSVTLKS